MAEQFKFLLLSGKYLSSTHFFSVTYNNITIYHILPKIHSFGYISVADCTENKNKKLERDEI